MHFGANPKSGLASAVDLSGHSKSAVRRVSPKRVQARACTNCQAANARCVRNNYKSLRPTEFAA